MTAFSPIARGPIAASGGANYVISTTSGTFTLSMQGAGKLITDIYPSGTFAVSGSVLGLLVGENLFAENGEFTVTMSEWQIALGKGLVADSGSFASTGNDVTFSVQRYLEAETGSFALSGQTVPAILDISIILDTEAFTVTMSDMVRIGANYDITAEVGTFAATFQDARIGRSYAITLEHNVFSLTGNRVAFRGFFSPYVAPEAWAVVPDVPEEIWTEAA